MTPSETLGDYVIVGRLGAGGAGEVLRVRDPTTGAEFAAKRVPPWADAEERLRFQREGELLARIRHRHVIQVHAARFDTPTPHLILPLLAGETLARRLEQGPLPPAAAIEVVRKLAAGLEAVHALGIVHRDLKPENVLFDEHDEPILADFGLGVALTRTTRMTQTGSILGTPSYMAPEQIQDSKSVGPRTDVYGLGAVFYHCLTGQPPFPARGSLEATLYAVLKDPLPPPSELVPSLEPWLDEVCFRALSRSPERRFPSVRALREALDAQGTNRPAPWAPAALLVAAGLLGAGAWALLPSTPPTSSSAPTPQTDAPTASAKATFEETLAAEDYAEALRQLAAVREDDPSYAEAALREVLDRAPVGSLPPSWVRLSELREATRALNAILDRRLEWELGFERADAVIEAARVASRHDGPEADTLLVEALDAWLVGYSALRAKVRDRRYPQLDDLELDPRRTPLSALVQDAVSRPKPAPPPIGVLSRLTPTLAGYVLSECRGQNREHARAWLAALPTDLGAPRDELIGDYCRSQGTREFDYGVGDEPPDLVLLQDLWEAMIAARRRAAGDAELSPTDRGVGVIVALCQGDLEEARRWAKGMPLTERTISAQVTLEIESYRADPDAAGAADLLSRAEARLTDLPDSRERWAAMAHIQVLRTQGGAQTWGEPTEPPDLQAVWPPWYRHFGQHLHWPETPPRGEQRQVWLPTPTAGR